MSQVTLPSVRDIQNIVTHDDDTNFYGTTMAQMWGNVVSYIPEMRGRSLAEDLTVLFEDVYQTKSLERLIAGYDLAAVRTCFVSMMQLHKVGHAHVIQYMAVDTMYWLERFNDKIEAIVPGEIFRRRLVSVPTIPDAVRHGWVH